MDEELLTILQNELGEVSDWEELCPGAYYLSISPDPDGKYSCGEFYLVLDSAPISQEARALGKPLQGTTALLYPIDPPDEAAWTAVMYELCKDRLAHDSSSLNGWTVTDAAMEGMELCPSYFGSFPVPPRTPWGWTLRYKPLDNGVYWMETDQAKTVLAVCHPVWSTEFSDGVKSAGEKLSHGETVDDKQPYYLFFNYETSCAALFELLRTRPQWLSAGLIHKAELMNAIWEYSPMYAMAYNAEEQAGLYDPLGHLVQILGEDQESQSLTKHMIVLNEEAGTDFIGFWK